MKIFIAVFGIAMGMVAIYVGTRLSDQSLGIVIGFFFGIIAGIPSSLMLLAMQKRQIDRQPREAAPQTFVLPYSGQTYANPVVPEQPVLDIPRLAPPKSEVKRIEW